MVGLELDVVVPQAPAGRMLSPVPEPVDAGDLRQSRGEPADHSPRI
jgi:hypothetical protein